MIFLILLLIFVTSVAVVSTFYMIRFLRYTMAIEDNLSEAIEVHQRSLEAFDKIVQMELFYDSPQVQAAVVELMEDVKLCKLATQSVADSFIRLSNNKYILLDTNRRPSKEEDDE